MKGLLVICGLMGSMAIANCQHYKVVGMERPVKDELSAAQAYARIADLLAVLGHDVKGKTISLQLIEQAPQRRWRYELRSSDGKKTDLVIWIFAKSGQINLFADEVKSRQRLTASIRNEPFQALPSEKWIPLAQEALRGLGFRGPFRIESRGAAESNCFYLAAYRLRKGLPVRGDVVQLQMDKRNGEVLQVMTTLFMPREYDDRLNVKITRAEALRRAEERLETHYFINRLAYVRLEYVCDPRNEKKFRPCYTIEYSSLGIDPETGDVFKVKNLWDFYPGREHYRL